MRAPWKALLLVVAPSLWAQEIDTGHFESSRSHGSLVDRAESEAEHRAYVELQKTADPAKRRALADAFLARFPQSWLLAGVYQVGAGASLERKDYARVLADGRASLRLLPENPALLVTLAQIEAAQGKLPQAKRDAKDALLWLSLFAAHSGVKPSEWRKTREKLEEYARGVIGPGQSQTEPAAKPRRKEKSERFAGSESCKPCHSAIYKSWRATGMATMLRPLPDAHVLADFSLTNEVRDSVGSVKIRTGGGDRPYFEFLTSGGGWKRFRVDYAIGSKWQQAYATRLPDERLFVFPIQYSAIEKRWLNYWSLIDPPGSERAQLDQFPRLTSATSYQRNCAVCHTSQLRLMRLDDQTMQKAAFREPGVNCEMCHGSSASHVEAMHSGERRVTGANVPPFRFSRLDHREATLICGQCHRQSALRNLGSNGEMNFTAVSPYYLRLEGQPYAELGNRAFYKDGRFRETTFIGEAFMRSACFRRGTAQCASCHNPHPADPQANRTSLKFTANPDEMCTQCHSAIGASAYTHTHHAGGSAGSRCAACHMPRIMNSLMFPAASHQIDDIPRADLTARFGQKESPSACLTCHAEKDAQWVAAQLRSW
jgi:Doubled CXXCH motif (Paired_CXXCH_1)/Cytochrome c554 and c-prime